MACPRPKLICVAEFVQRRRQIYPIYFTYNLLIESRVHRAIYKVHIVLRGFRSILMQPIGLRQYRSGTRSRGVFNSRGDVVDDCTTKEYHIRLVPEQLTIDRKSVV